MLWLDDDDDSSHAEEECVEDCFFVRINVKSNSRYPPSEHIKHSSTTTFCVANNPHELSMVVVVVEEEAATDVGDVAFNPREGKKRPWIWCAAEEGELNL